MTTDEMKKYFPNINPNDEEHCMFVQTLQEAHDQCAKEQKGMSEFVNQCSEIAENHGLKPTHLAVWETTKNQYSLDL